MVSHTPMSSHRAHIKQGGARRRDTVHLYRVVFKPGRSLNPISDEWGNIEIEGEALADSQGKFGTWTVREQVASP